MGFWTGVTTVANAIGAVMNLRGTPGAPPAPSLVAQKPNLSFQRGKVSLGEGATTTAGLGGYRIATPYPSKESEWVSLQKKYLAYLNMAEAFEDPGKVRRAIKLKVS
jgi:hypothetical protein|tara:strand:+ start:92 stop:412 length:321 start_codon:yes stop_codon:yes gene_type:complete